MARPPDAEGAPCTGAPTSNPDHEEQPEGIAAVEWRVTWRRAGWGPSTRNKTRTFCTEVAARRFVDHRLGGADRPDLSPLTLVRIDRRTVGAWELDR